MSYQSLFAALWQDYINRNPHANRVHQLFDDEGETKKAARESLHRYQQLALILVQSNKETIQAIAQMLLQHYTLVREKLEKILEFNEGKQSEKLTEAIAPLKKAPKDETPEAKKLREQQIALLEAVSRKKKGKAKATTPVAGAAAVADDEESS